MEHVMNMGRVIKTHTFTDEERRKLDDYPAEAFLDGRFPGILAEIGCLEDAV